MRNTFQRYDFDALNYATKFGKYLTDTGRAGIKMMTKYKFTKTRQIKVLIKSLQSTEDLLS